MLDNDEFWMQHALGCAELARNCHEVPVGAVLVSDGQLIAQSYNQPIHLHDPTAHAEILAIRQAAAQLQNYRLPGMTLYVTLEPCAMCLGAMVHARISRCVFGASDPKSGAAGTVIALHQAQGMNHKLAVTSGVLAQPCGQILRDFSNDDGDLDLICRLTRKS